MKIQAEVGRIDVVKRIHGFKVICKKCDTKGEVDIMLDRSKSLIFRCNICGNVTVIDKI